MITVQIIRQSTGNPVASTQVGIGLDGVYYETTDSNGEAHFSSLSPCDAEVYVENKVAYKGRLEGRKVIYV